MRNDSLAFPSADMEQAFSHATLGAEGFAAFDTPVSIHVHSFRKRLADADGLSAKAVIDALMLSGLLQNDSPEFVNEVIFTQEKSQAEYTVIKIESHKERLRALE